MSVFFTSDEHFNHENIITRFNRGFGMFNSVNHHNQHLVQKWWETVSEEDEVWVLGDAGMGDKEKSLELFRGLPGIKHLIPGNHDPLLEGLASKNHIAKWLPLYQEVFTVHPALVERVFITGYGPQKVLLCHFPYKATSLERPETHAKFRPVNNGLPLVHGHSHSTEILNPNSPLEYHVGVDAHGFAPVPETRIITWLEKLHADGVL